MNQYLLSIMKGQRGGFTARLITCLLLPLSVAYGAGVFCHRNFYRLRGAYKASKPIISIGNITVGGTGKTPLVIWLARILQGKGIKPIVLTRGYMTKASKNSDEADMLHEQIPDVPVLTGGDRVANILKANETLPADLYIADDAFQHWPLRRDLNIVAIDAGNPFGNGHLLPAGILREPLSALKRADVFVLTKTEGCCNLQAAFARLKEINSKALIVESRYQSLGAVDVFSSELLAEDFLRNKKLTGFCAIGDPVSFEGLLRKSGSRIAKLITFMDHHVYQKEDIQRIVEFARGNNSQVLVTTHKDAVKLRIFKDLFNGFSVVYIPIQLEITKGSDEFVQKIMAVCRR